MESLVLSKIKSNKSEVLERLKARYILQIKPNVLQQVAHRRAKGRSPAYIPVDLKRVEGLAAQGLRPGEISLVLGFTRQTFYNKLRDDEEFKEAVERGKAKGVALVTTSMLKQIQDGDAGLIKFFLNNMSEGLKEKNTTVVAGDPDNPIRHTVEAAPRRHTLEELLAMGTDQLAALHSEMIKRLPDANC